MTTVVVGGHSRNIGKTSVAAGLIAAFPDLGWTAMKITQYGHGLCSINGRECGCAVEEHPYAILDEQSREGTTDSSRFLMAGARRSLWVRTKQGQLDLAMPVLRTVIESEPFVLIESNSILRFIQPALYIVVLSYSVTDFKRSARDHLDKADAVVLVGGGAARPRWDGISDALLGKLPTFPVEPPTYVTQGLREFVGSRLEALT